jgi:hypothetical protein
METNTHIERKCERCGEICLFWLFGRTPCKCSLPNVPIKWGKKVEDINNHRYSEVIHGK